MNDKSSTKVQMEATPPLPTLGQDNPALQLDDEDEDPPTITSSDPVPDKTEYEEIISGDDFDDLEFQPNLVSRIEDSISSGLRAFRASLGGCGDFAVDHGAAVAVAVLFLAYFVAAVRHHSLHNQGSMEWCDGLGFLLILTLCLVWGFLYYWLLKPFYLWFMSKTKTGRGVVESLKPMRKAVGRILNHR